MQNKLHILLAILLISIMAVPNGAFAYSDSHDHQHIQSSFQNTTHAQEIRPAEVSRLYSFARIIAAAFDTQSSIQRIR
jgi:hypothetical protein